MWSTRASHRRRPEVSATDNDGALEFIAAMRIHVVAPVRDYKRRHDECGLQARAVFAAAFARQQYQARIVR
jgi:hypothetical protein